MSSDKLSINHMPREMIALIASHLDTFSDRSHLSRTSWYFYNCLNMDNARKFKAENVLLHASYTGSIEMLDFAMRVGIKRSPAAWKATALAYERGNISLIQHMIDHYQPTLSPNWKTDSGTSFMHIAAGFGHVAVMRLLALHYVEIDPQETSSGVTPFMRAALRGHIRAAEFLFDHGAQVDTRDKLGRTALYNAVAFNQVPMAKWLLDYGADPNAQTNSGRRVLRCAFFNIDMIQLLLKRGANPNLEVDEDHLKPLQFAMGMRLAWLVRILLYYGADPNYRGIGGQTALHYAAVCRDMTLVQLLVSHGGDLDQGSDGGDTPRQFLAVWNNSPYSQHQDTRAPWV